MAGSSTLRIAVGWQGSSAVRVPLKTIRSEVAAMYIAPCIPMTCGGGVKHPPFCGAVLPLWRTAAQCSRIQKILLEMKPNAQDLYIL